MAWVEPERLVIESDDEYDYGLHVLDGDERARHYHQSARGNQLPPGDYTVAVDDRGYYWVLTGETPAGGEEWTREGSRGHW